MTNVRARADAGFVLGVVDKSKLNRVEISAEQVKMVAEPVRDMVAAYPFLGSLASSGSIFYHAVRDVPFAWAATDALGVFLNANPGGYFETQGEKALTHENRMFILGHEVLHQVLESVSWKWTHEQQGWVPVPRSHSAPDGMLPFDNRTWQQAEDARINHALLTDRVGLPPNGVHTHPAIKWDMDFGEAYAIQHATNFPPNPNQQNQGQGGQQPPQQGQGNQPPPPGQGGQQPPQQGQGGQQPPQQGQGGQGQGQPGQPTPHPQDDVLAPGQGGDAASDEAGADTPQDAQAAAEALDRDAHERAVRVSRAKNAARQAGAGSCCVEELVKAAREPGVDWRSYVPGFLARCAGNSAFDFTRPARPPVTRELLGLDSFFAPNRAGNGCDHVVFVGDISGSIQEPEHRAMLGAVSEMLSVLRPKEFTIIWCDDRIVRVDHDVDLDTDFSSYVIPKGGGTDFHPPFAWIEQHDRRPDGLIYFTDFYGAAPVDAPPYPVLWLATTKLNKPISGGAWGEVVHIPVHELHEGAS